jgi:tripartite-type tricarboxylate transporter receptor subunit TctC
MKKVLTKQEKVEIAKAAPMAVADSTGDPFWAEVEEQLAKNREIVKPRQKSEK